MSAPVQFEAMVAAMRAAARVVGARLTRAIRAVREAFDALVRAWRATRPGALTGARSAHERPLDHARRLGIRRALTRTARRQARHSLA